MADRQPNILILWGDDVDWWNISYNSRSQTIMDTGPLTKKRMETIDDEVAAHALRFIDDAHKAKTPFFL